jgi:RNA polymerase sigma-70 factor (ECF subfamily)
MQAGDERAFEALVKRYQSPLLNYIRHLLQDEDQQEDVLQFVLLKLYLSANITRECPNQVLVV